MPRSIRPSITRRSVLAGSLVSAVALALTACGSKGSADGSVKGIEVKDGVVYVKGKRFVVPAETDNMSSAERAYFVQGNLAAAYHNGHNKESAYADGNVVMLGAQPVMTCLRGDDSAAVLAEKLNQVK